jgi:hypothetical protein
MRFALILAVLLTTTAPALAGGIADAINGRATTGAGAGVGIGTALQPQPQQWTYPANQPTWIAPPASRLEPPQRLQTTCYTIGNIITCY